MNHLFAPFAESHFRSDIQGVRAIGAILILIFHIWIHQVSGGVDVFFVVSGYLMASLLLRQYARDNAIRPFQFWGRIIKRVVPSAYFVLVTTLVVSYFYIPPVLWLESINEFIASALHIENFQLMRVGVDYLARENPPSPFQQFWALSMQIQFYFLLPLILVPALWLCNRSRSLIPLLIIGSLVFLVSFTYSVAITASAPETAYFNTGARVWEFFAGVILAVIAPAIRLSGRVANLLSIAGVILLFSVGLLFSGYHNFPGYVALFPVLAAVLLIISGSNSAESTIVGRVLGSRYLVMIGSASFTIYLWHWPILIFLQHQFDSVQLNLWQGLLVIGLSIFCATITTRLLESPFRQIPGNKPLLPYVVGACFFTPAIAFGFASRTYTVGLYEAAERNRVEAKKAEQRSDIEISLQDDATNLSLEQFVAVKWDTPTIYGSRCHASIESPEVSTCESGDLEADKVVVLAGGSHAAQWNVVFSGLGKLHGFKLVNMTKSACALGYYTDRMHESCAEWNRRVIEELESLQPDLVITNSTRADRFNETDTIEFIPGAYVDQWRNITNLGIPVLGIRDNPWFSKDPNECLWKNQQDATNCARPLTEIMLPENPADEVEVLLTGFHSVDMTPIFCSDGFCPAHVDGVMIYRDTHHFNDRFGGFIVLAVEAILAKQVPHLDFLH